jgi:uncharacterized protein YneR
MTIGPTKKLRWMSEKYAQKKGEVKGLFCRYLGGAALGQGRFSAGIMAYTTSINAIGSATMAPGRGSH